MTAVLTMLRLTTLGLEGQWNDFRAIIVIAIAVVMLIGSIYMLLASNFGARLGYLITMIALSTWVVILSTMWLVGAPGTTTSTGPRGPEPHWVPFTADSEQGKDLSHVLDSFPDGWDKIVTKDAKGELVGTKYPGNLDARGDFEQVRTTVSAAIARLATEQKLPVGKPVEWQASNWNFRSSDLEPATPEERLLKPATVRFTFEGTRLYFGTIIPAVSAADCVAPGGDPIAGCRPHAAFTAFAFRDKGKVYLQALMFLLAALTSFFVHLFLIARYEAKRKEEDAALTLEPSLT